MSSNTAAIRYGDWRDLDNDIQLPRYAELCAQIGQFSSVLDVGCGEGVLLRHLLRRGYQGSYLGIDHDAAAVARGQSYHDHASIRLDSDVTFTTSDRWDVVVLSEVLYYLPNPVDTLEHYSNRVRSGGRLIVTIYLRPGRPRLSGIIRSIIDKGYPRGALHCAVMVNRFLSRRFSPTISDIPIPGTSQYWRMWNVTVA